MNTYEIFFTRENGTTGSDRFTAPDEKQARKDFRECYRHSTGTITEVKLVSENVLASKEQERKALESIRAIIATLGPNSYLATAFEGCLQDAEDNIEYDAAFSMCARWQDSEKKVSELTRELEASKKECTDARAAAAQLDNDLKRALQKQLPADLYQDLWMLVNQAAEDATAQIMSAAATLATLADTPNDIAVKHGLNVIKAATTKRNNANSLLERLEKYE